MVDIEKQILYFQKYCDKLMDSIQYKASFKLFGLCIVDKQMVDDIICCLDTYLPKVFMTYRDRIGNTEKRIETLKLYRHMIETIKIKPFIGNSSYAVKKNNALYVIYRLKAQIKEDYIFIKNNYPDLLK